MNIIPRALALATVACLLSTPARADSIRRDRCTDEGEACANAIPGGDPNDPTVPNQGWLGGGGSAQVAGICRQAKCNSREPGPSGAVIVVDCLRCIATDGSEDDGGCTCRMPATSTPRSVSAVMLLVGVVALAWSRRRG